MSYSRKNQQLLAAALVLALLLSAVTPLFYPVYADDPPPEPTAETQAGAGEAPAVEAPPPPEQPAASPSAEDPPPTDEPAAEEPAGEESRLIEPSAEQPPQEDPAGEPVLQLDQIPQPGPPVQLPDPYYYYGGTKYEYTTFADAISGMSANNRTPDDFTLYAEADTYVENVAIDGSAWTSTPSTLRVVSEGDSSDTTISGTFTVRNMLNFLLQGFTITGGITASDNEGTLTLNDVTASTTTTDGIVIENHNGEVVLEEVHADDNAGVGASIHNTEGTDGVTVTDSTFNGNNTTPDDGMQGGLQVVSNGEVVLENVEASGNTDGDGASAQADGITVTGGSYNSNTSPAAGFGSGLYGSSAGGAIRLDGVEASSNEETGAALSFTSADPANEIVVRYSSFKSNQEFGVWAQPESGTVTFECNQFCNNTLGARMVPVGEIVIYLKCPCTCEDAEKPEYIGVKLSETEPTIVNPGNGMLVTIPVIEPTDEDLAPRVKVLALLEKELPGELEGEDLFLAGLDILLINAVLPDDAYENEEHQITVEFYIPAYKMDRMFAVLWWDEDAGAWVEVEFDLVPHSRMPGGKIVVHWPEPGLFVLVERGPAEEAGE